MVNFDWQRFLDSNHVEYVPGVRGNVEVRCPFCGAADHSHHMSISLEGKGWRCWRKPQHRGIKAARLVQALLNCSWERAVQLTGEATFHPVENLMDKLNALLAPPKPTRSKLELPVEFKSFTDKPSARPYNRYLHDRGFLVAKLPREMYYATHGDYAGRIIIPVRYNKRLIGWTGRTIYPGDRLRYKDSEDHPIKNHLPWYDELKTTKATTLVLTEGPFDALKVQWLGRKDRITSTCFFTSEPSESQLGFLHELLPRFDRCIVLLDRDTLPATLRLVSSLRGFDLEMGELPHDKKDPGQLVSRDQLLDAIRA